MGRVYYFVIGAVVASFVIAIATSYICRTLDSFSEAMSDREFEQPIGRYVGMNGSVFHGGELSDEASTQTDQPESKEQDG